MIYYTISLIFPDHSAICYYHSHFERSYAFLFDHYYNIYPNLRDLKIIEVEELP